MTKRADEYRAELEARKVRMAGPFWNDDDGSRKGAFAAELSANGPAGEVVQSADPIVPETRRFSSPEPSSFQNSSNTHMAKWSARMNSLEHRVESLAKQIQQRAIEQTGGPACLENPGIAPTAYDGRNAGRISTCVRVFPSTISRVKQAQATLALRTLAAAWEYLLQIGLRAVERRQTE